MIIGLHKGLKRAFFDLSSNPAKAVPFKEQVVEVPSYMDICLSQIESYDYRDTAEFEAFYE